MLAAHRQRELEAIVSKQGSARVSDLASHFNVTEETIRRDLDKLESDGRLQRSHGGAVSLNREGEEQPYWVREITNLREKDQIATEALKRIGEDNTLYLDASSTVLQLARILPDQPMTIMSHSLQVALALMNHTQARVLCPGGFLSAPSLSVVGPITEKSLADIHVDFFFTSCRALSADHGIMAANEEQARVRQMMIQRAEHVILMADISKIGKKSLFEIAALTAAEELITNKPTTEEKAQQLTKIEHIIKVTRCGEHE